MIREFDKIEQKYIAETKGGIINAITEAYWSTFHFVKNANESAYKDAVDAAILDLMENFEDEDLRVIAEEIFTIFLF